MKQNLLTVFLAAVFSTCVASSHHRIELAATNGTVSAPFVLTNGYLTQPLQTSVAAGGRAVFPFSITNAGQFLIQAVAETTGASAQSLYLNIDSDPSSPEMKWEIPAATGLSTNVFSVSPGKPRYFDLATGDHQLIIRGSDANLKLLQLRLIPRLAPPMNIRIISSQ